MQTYIWPILLPLLFLAYSLPLFLRVFATTQMVIDEEFHLRQGLHFCNKRFEVVSKELKQSHCHYNKCYSLLCAFSGILRSPLFLVYIYFL